MKYFIIFFFVLLQKIFKNLKTNIVLIKTSKFDIHNNLEKRLMSSNLYSKLNLVHRKWSNFCLAFRSKMIQKRTVSDPFNKKKNSRF